MPMEGITEEKRINAMRHETRIQKAIADKCSYMSTSKWKHLFSLAKELDATYVTNVKLLLEDKMRTFHLPNEDDFINEKYLEEYWGVVELKEIEWLFIPSEVSYKRTNRTELLAPRKNRKKSDNI